MIGAAPNAEPKKNILKNWMTDIYAAFETGDFSDIICRQQASTRTGGLKPVSDYLAAADIPSHQFQLSGITITEFS